MRRRYFKVKLFVGTAIAVFAVIKYCASTEINPYTGKEQHISLSEDQEIAIGLQSAPQMKQQYGGFIPKRKISRIS